MSLDRRAWIVAGVGALAALGGIGSAWRRHRPDVAAPAEHSVGELWSMRFERPEGGELAMAQFRGKPLLINFWATWCAPCVREMPEIDRFHREFAARGIQVVGLAIDGQQPVREFLSRVKVGFAIGLGGMDGTDLVHQLGNLQGALPFSVLIDAEGQLRQRKLGETSFDELRTWLADIRA